MTTVTDRSNLLYRKNCEGYLLYGTHYVLAKNTGLGYVLFPGGGVDERESPEEALRRETFEETGAIIGEKLKKVGVLYFDWGQDWAKTKKQKVRFNKFGGEEMHLFVGRIKSFKKLTGKQEDAWRGKKLMLIDEAINVLEHMKPFPENMHEYYSLQLKCLLSLKKEA